MARRLRKTVSPLLLSVHVALHHSEHVSQLLNVSYFCICMCNSKIYVSIFLPISPNGDLYNSKIVSFEVVFWPPGRVITMAATKINY
jgi:hypothetical protein